MLGAVESARVPKTSIGPAASATRRKSSVRSLEDQSKIERGSLIDHRAGIMRKRREGQFSRTDFRIQPTAFANFFYGLRQLFLSLVISHKARLGVHTLPSQRKCEQGERSI